MLGRPIDAGDILMFVILATGVVVVVIGLCAQLLKPIPGSPMRPSPEKLALLTRNMRLTLVLLGSSLGLSAVRSLLLHRVPDWLGWSVTGVQGAVLVILFLQLFHRRRERRLSMPRTRS